MMCKVMNYLLSAQLHHCVVKIHTALTIVSCLLPFPLSELAHDQYKTGHCNLVMEDTRACSLLAQPAEPAAKSRNINKLPAVPAHSLLLLSTVLHSLTAVVTRFLLS